jgi:hypothetical protein
MVVLGVAGETMPSVLGNGGTGSSLPEISSNWCQREPIAFAQPVSRLLSVVTPRLGLLPQPPADPRQFMPSCTMAAYADFGTKIPVHGARV